MADYTITFARSARKELENLETIWVNKIFPAIEALAKNPRPKGVKKIKGEENIWRIRVGDYRVIYAVDDRDLIVSRRRIHLSAY